jgi:uncharacterized protein (TIGR03032 family)
VSEQPLPASVPPADSGLDSAPSSRILPPRRILTSHSPSFVQVLADLKASLLISTYQAGKVVVVQVHKDDLFITYHNFDRAMGIAVSPEQIAVGANNQIWFLVNSRPIPRVSGPAFDSCFLARGSHFTGEIHIHEMDWSGRELWVVNTLFSCLCTVAGPHSFVPRWKPRFVSTLAAEDRCHLNGLALENGRPRFVTTLGETDSPRGWKTNQTSGGCLIDVASGQVVLRGLCMPHSPRIHQGRIWFIESGSGRLATVDPTTGVQTVAELPGYGRGLAFHGPYAFVGLSKIRQTSSFSGLPIASSGDSLKCGVAVVELSSGRIAALLEFDAEVEELFDVRVNPFTRSPLFSGPDARNDGTPPLWVIPPVQI